MTSNNVSVLLSPFWESVDEQWVGGTLVVLAGLMFLSQALAVARAKSWRMFLTTLMFFLLAGMMTAPLADGFSPRELQHWLMMPDTLGTLTVVQILWICITIFASIREEVNEKKHGFWYWTRLLSIRFVTVLPSPVFVLFLIWVEQNVFMNSTNVKPQTLGLIIAGICCVAFAMLALIMILMLTKHQRLCLHLFLGCLLVAATSMLPCLTQKLAVPTANATYDPPSIYMTLALAALFGVVIYGIFGRRKQKTSIN